MCLGLVSYWQKISECENCFGWCLCQRIDSAKSKLWHGETKDALTKLTKLGDNVTDEATRSKITGLYDYIHRNQAYIVNYDERKRANKTYTSQVAEYIDSLINTRHKTNEEDAMDPWRLIMYYKLEPWWRVMIEA